MEDDFLKTVNLNWDGRAFTSRDNGKKGGRPPKVRFIKKEGAAMLYSIFQDIHDSDRPLRKVSKLMGIPHSTLYYQYQKFLKDPDAYLDYLLKE